jgi:D-alanyl-D-alanine carboxypeptidase (penicillin-binding protein 5/6)
MLFLRRAQAIPFLFGLLSVTAGAAPAKRAAPTRPETPADNTHAYKGAIVMDAASGTVLFEDRADYVGPPASVTKLMTFLLVHDRIARGDLTLATPVNVTAESAKTGGSQVYLAEKEVFSVEEMLYALMIASANDAASALAIHLTGSRAAFVEQMNARAQSLGMDHTTFRSPHGLPPSSRQLEDSDVTSPRDLAKLSLHLLKATDVVQYTSVKQRTFRPGPKRIDMVNHNHLLGKVAGVDGLKTGFTRGAGFCLAATALRNGRRLIVVTMGSPDSKTRDIKIAELLERGFAKLPAAVPFQSPESAPIAPAPRNATPPAKLAPPVAPEPAPSEAVIKFSIPPKR